MLLLRCGKTKRDGKKFVLTDAIFNHTLATTAGVNGANVIRETSGGDQEELFRAFVVDQENVIFHFQTGFEFGPDEKVIFVTGGTASASVNVTLIGYETDL